MASLANNPVAVIRQNLTAMQPEFKAALPSHVPVEKFSRVAMTAIQANPDLIDADRRSLFGACVRLAQDGLLPDGREAALVIFNSKSRSGGWEKKVQAMPMIAGILKKVRQSGEVASVDCHVVHENDRFTYRPGLDAQPIFEPEWFGNRGKPIGAYAIATLKSGEIVPPEIMNIEQIEKVRNVSRSKDKGPWADWWEEMARKTVMRRFAKRLPSSTDLEDQIFGKDETMATTVADAPQLRVIEAEHAETEAHGSRLDALENEIEDAEIVPEGKPDADMGEGFNDTDGQGE